MTLSLTDIGIDPDESIQANLEQGVLIVGLGQAGGQGLWTVSMIEYLSRVVQRIACNESIRVLVLEAVSKDFCSGLDLNDFAAITKTDPIRVRTAMDEFEQCCLRLMPTLEQPVLAQVHGQCQSAGIKWLEGCDIVYADHRAEFFLDESDFHQLSMVNNSQSEPKANLISTNTESFDALAQQVFDGQEAARRGLVTQSFPHDLLTHEIRALASSLIEKDRLALQFTKETIAHVGTMSWDASVNYTAAKFAELTSRQSGASSSRAIAIASFLAGESKPGKGG
jgi:enoyl-CoA hydratase/carnithine racemase